MPDLRHGAGHGGIAIPCHFGEWLQGLAGPNGPVALITLVPKGVHVIARRIGAARIASTAIGQGTFPRSTLIRLHRALSLPHPAHSLLRLPFAPGLGTGMSTATLMAHAYLSGFQGSALALARGTIFVEGASDPLMFAEPDRIIWSSRQGRVLGRVPAPFRAHLVGGFFGPPAPTRATDCNYEDISDLLAEWPKARTLAHAAALARESAVRCHARRALTRDPMPDLTRDLGALGWITSHSGAARAVVFAPGTVPRHAAAALREAGLYGVQGLSTGSRRD